jgi:hypothetical protein
VWSNGDQEWYANDKLHRIDKPAVICADGIHQWWVNGKIHRVDGPAFVTPNGYAWYVNNRLHRLDGPATEEFRNGQKDWYIMGKPLSKEQFDRHPLVIFYRLCQEIL